jgi:tRNA 2-thiouridine synthesizing protein A
MEPDVLDCRGLNCPMPIVKISRAMKGLQPGSSLRVLATDPSFGADVQAWVTKTGQVLVQFIDRGSEQEALIQRT